MLSIRLQRIGRKNDPSFRIVVIPKTAGAKSNRFIEVLGFYDAVRKKKSIKEERVQHWLDKGAQPSETIWNLLVGEKIIDGKKVNVLPQKTPKIKEEVKQEKVDTPKEEVKEESKEQEVSVEKTETEEKTKEIKTEAKQEPIEGNEGGEKT